MQQRKVVIVGGGIAGLASAHLLAHYYPLLQVTLMEQSAFCGGLARSSSFDSLYPSQYCWHVIGDDYKCFKRLLSEIPDGKGRSLLQHLVPIQHCFADCYDISKWMQLFRYLLSVFGLSNLLKFYWKITTHRPEDVRDMSWLQFVCQNQNLSEKQIQLAVDVWSPILGIDPVKGSASSVLQILQKNSWFARPVPFHVFNGPTTPQLFLHWQKELRRQGVNILLNCKVVKLQPHPDDTTSLHGLWFTEKGRVGFVSADAIICALPPFQTAEILPFSALKFRCRQLGQRMSIKQVSIPLFLKKRLTFPHNHTIMLVADAPWQLVIEPIFQFWNKKNLNTFVPPDTGDYLEIGLGNPYKAGIISKKPWPKCTLKEIQTEIWFQIVRAFQKKGCIGGLENNEPLGIIMWRDYYWSEGECEWKTKNLKRSSNAGTWSLRPHEPQENVPFENLWLAGDYMRSGEEEVLSMESAALSGVVAAEDFLQNTFGFS